MTVTDGAAGDRFHNPYSFVPFGRRPTEGPLADAEPRGHARYSDGALSGTLAFTMEVRTPLLIPDRWDRDGDRHRTFGVLADAAGQPVLHGASVKGALRSAYEVVTGSRVPFAGSWSEPLSRRLEASSAIGLIPVRIVRPADGPLQAEILLGDIPGVITSNELRDRVTKKDVALPAALLPAYDRGLARVLDLEGKEQHRRQRIKDLHGSRVKVGLRPYVHRSGRFQLWGVHSLSATEGGTKVPDGRIETGDERSPFRSYRADDGELTADGYLFLTGRNARRKHYERVFFSTSAEPPRLPVHESVEAGWRSVINAYLAAHKPQDLRSTAALGGMADDWSAHMLDKERRTLRDGDLCYAVIDRTPEGGHRIVSLQPVSISRRPYAVTPLDLVPEDVRPAQRSSEASPADRLFGWVRETSGRGDGAGGGATALRGAVRVESVEGPDSASVVDLASDGPGSIPLAILGAPKPANPRLYFGDAEGRPLKGGKRSSIDLALPGGGDKRAATGLRGRKVYPPHRPAETEGVAVPPEARRQGDLADSQNSTVTAWVRPGSRITVRLGLTEVSEAELGALIEMLALCSGRGRLRMGHAKPLGFGSLEVDPGTIELRVASGEEIRASYAEGLVPAPRRADEGRIDALRGAFRAAQPAEGTLGWADGAPLAIRRAFEGPDDDRRVTYPVALDQRASVLEGYAWFVENERADRPLSLPMIDAPDPTLPVLTQKPRPQGGRGGKGGQGRKGGKGGQGRKGGQRDRRDRR